MFFFLILAGTVIANSGGSVPQVSSTTQVGNPMKMIMVARQATTTSVTPTSNVSTTTTTTSGNATINKPITITVPSQHGGISKTMTIAPKQQGLESGSGNVISVSTDGLISNTSQVSFACSFHYYYYFF
jgi:hypothetical protein